MQRHFGSTNILSANQNALNSIPLRSSLHINQQSSQNSLIKKSSSIKLINSKMDHSSKQNQYSKQSNKVLLLKRVSFYKSQQNKSINEKNVDGLTQLNQNSKSITCTNEKIAPNSYFTNKYKIKQLQSYQQNKQIRKRYISVPNRQRQQLLKECTFRPKITKKSDLMARQRSGKNVFENLYNFQKKIQVKIPGSNNVLSYKQAAQKKQFSNHYSKYKILEQKKIIQQHKKFKQANHQISSKQKNQFEKMLKFYRSNQTSLKNFSQIRNNNKKQKSVELEPIQIYKIYRRDRNSLKDLTIEQFQIEADNNLKHYIQNALQKIQTSQRNLKTVL